MNQARCLIFNSLLLALCLFHAAPGTVCARQSQAPLYDRQQKVFGSGGETIISRPSRFPRRMDYREEEAYRKQEAEEAARLAAEEKRRSEENARKLQLQQLESYKKRQQLAIDANNRAVNLGKQGRWLEALNEHEQAMQLDPQNKQFRINLSAARVAFGQQRMASGDLTGAAGLFRKALAAANDNGLAGKMLDEVMRRQGRDPLSADVRITTGDQLAAVGDLEGAAVEYQSALQLESSGRTYVKMGDMAYRYGQVSTAMNWYRNAIVKDPECAAAHRQLGLLEYAQKDFTGAGASLRKAVILDPKDAAACQALVEIWRRQVASNPLLAENRLGLAGALQLTGDYAGAESEYNRLEALDAKHPGLAPGRASLMRAIQHGNAERHRLAAETLFNQGLKREALSEISQAVMMEPKNDKYQFLLGECLEAIGDFNGAHQAYMTCVLIDPSKNKEAAARMRQMQSSSTPRNLVQGAGQLSNPLGRPLSQSQQMQTALPQQAVAPPRNQATLTPDAMAQEAIIPKKDTFEGGRGYSGAIGPAGMSFRTHDEPPLTPGSFPVSQSGSPKAADQMPAQAQTTRTSLNDAMSQVTDAEAQRDYTRAIELLREALGQNLQNAEVHHRLAVNLMASGQIVEAISEFRIASALAKTNKAYADDLARAMVIHKKSLASTNESSNAGSSSAAAAGVTK